MHALVFLAQRRSYRTESEWPNLWRKCSPINSCCQAHAPEDPAHIRFQIGVRWIEHVWKHKGDYDFTLQSSLRFRESKNILSQAKMTLMAEENAMVFSRNRLDKVRHRSNKHFNEIKTYPEPISAAKT